MLPALTRPDLLARRTLQVLEVLPSLGKFKVAEIDPSVADTAAMCERYGVDQDDSANCVVVAAKRGGEVALAGCVILASTKADVNGMVRKNLEARKVSFASMDDALAATHMEYGGITPFGLPEEWPLLVDARVVEREQAVFGSGLRRSKLFAPGSTLTELPNCQVIDGLAIASVS